MAKVAQTDNVSTEHLASLEVLNEYGEPVMLSKLWQTQPAVLVFVRHFG
jgi:hypothetical protein